MPYQKMTVDLDEFGATVTIGGIDYTSNFGLWMKWDEYFETYG